MPGLYELVAATRPASASPSAAVAMKPMAVARLVNMKTGQTHMMRYMKPLLELIQGGKIDPSFVVSHRVPIDKAPEMYKTFCDKQDHCTKVVLDPWANAAAA